MSGETLKHLLMMADQNWEFGRLARARESYDQALAIAPNSWHAAFQLAWIDGAFRKLEDRELAALRRPDLPTAAQATLQALERRAVDGRAIYLEGQVADWDIEALRNQPGDNDAAWWEVKAAQAAAAGQYGLAQVCYGEAEESDPERYFDPPREFKSLHTPGTHLRSVRATT